MNKTDFELLAAIEKTMAEGDMAYSHIELAEAYKNLQKMYAGLKHTALRKKDLSMGLPTFLLSIQVELAAYLRTRMPATFAVANKILKQIFSFKLSKKIESILDLGTGTGAVLWAAMENTNLSKVSALDQDAAMIKLAQKVAGYSTNPFWQRVNWKHMNIDKNLELPSHDLVTLSYFLIEQQKDLRQTLFEKVWVLANQAIVIIEPGTPRGFSNCMEARDFFLSKGGFIAAPCSHHGRCPIHNNNDDWCHFAERIERSFWQKSLKKGTLGYEDEPYSYLIITKEVVDREGDRILKSPSKHSGHILFDVCASDNIKKITISRKQGSVFKTAKKMKWGEALEIPR
ncbi:small ribosomal subunit Rsm22 family protein [Rickettsiella endosymbiont of Aleochara curtula]|uniref:small ribosomal subunit Rsm22 family protein n=1 Tax=Rickettsiella endosymbiont of Aleochara curtula TaxID=3077936 RepID=UPI00313D2B5A